MIIGFSLIKVGSYSQSKSFFGIWRLWHQLELLPSPKSLWLIESLFLSIATASDHFRLTKEPNLGHTNHQG